MESRARGGSEGRDNMIALDTKELVFVLGEPADAGTGRIVAVDDSVLEWLARRAAVLERLKAANQGSPHDDDTDRARRPA